MESNQNADILDSREIALQEKYTFSDLLKFYYEALYDTIKKHWIWNHKNLALILALSPTNKLTLLTFLIAPKFFTYIRFGHSYWNLSLLCSAKSMSLIRVHWQCLPVTPIWGSRRYSEDMIKKNHQKHSLGPGDTHSFIHSSDIFAHIQINSN